MQKDHIRPLTGLRWIAALFVYLSHTVGDNNLPSSLLQFTENGYNGVTIFFVLSAFILTVNYHASLNLRGGVALRYLTARAARILPIYYIVLVFVLLQTKLTGGEFPGWSWKHLLLIQVWDTDIGISMGLNGPAWSIGVEVFFYLIFPFLLMLSSKMLRKLGLSLVLTVIGIGLISFFYFTFRNGSVNVGDSNSTHRWLYRSPLTRIGDFVYGMGLAGIYLSAPKSRPTQKIASYLTYASFALILLMMYITIPRTAISWDLQYAIPAGILILGLAVNRTSYLAQFLSSKVLVQLGEISFTFYLIHKVLPFDNYLKNTSAFAIVYYLLNIAILCAISYSLHQFVEKPSRRFLNSRFR
jgi:peptidoglycan/LPS O-acetylase OafA/YrhL